MLKKSITELIHPCFGKIRFDEKFARVLELKPFRDLAFKSQLGTKALSKKFVNAKHTRFTHSIGVYYLTSLLLKTCKDKFSNYIEISSQDEEALLLAALGHDIGHLAFSHSLEIKDKKSHEEMTIELFEQYRNPINIIFGYDIVSKVISIYLKNIKVKEEGKSSKIEEDLDILFVFSSLLVGTIDCDRMEYITTDRYMVTGEKLDFRSIFDHITIVLLNNAPTVGFEREAIPIIESLLTNRFEQYEQIYFDEDSTLIEIALKEFVKQQISDLDDLGDYTEYDILNMLNNINKELYSKAIPSRLANIILRGEREHILFKKFTSEGEFDFFMNKIRSIAGDDFNLLWIQTEHKTNCIYNPNKNKVYIKDDDGVVKDITEISLKITSLKIDYYYVMIDLHPIYNLKTSICKQLHSLFNDNAVEIEKKFVLPQNMNNEYDCIFNKIRTIPNIFFMDSRKTINYDQYYIPSVKVPNGMAMRLRKTDAGNCYFIKMPANDGTSITKREEQSFPNCSSLEEFVKLAENFIYIRGYRLSGKLNLTEGVKIITQRTKMLAKIYDSTVEFAYDTSRYEYNGVCKNDCMLECELKQGDDLVLWYLAKHIKSLGFIETNESKQTRAKKALGLK